MPTVCSLFLVYVWLTHLHNNSNNNSNNNNNNNNNNNDDDDNNNEYLYRISYQFY